MRIRSVVNHREFFCAFKDDIEKLYANVSKKSFDAFPDDVANKIEFTMSVLKDTKNHFEQILKSYKIPTDDNVFLQHHVYVYLPHKDDLLRIIVAKKLNTDENNLKKITLNSTDTDEFSIRAYGKEISYAIYNMKYELMIDRNEKIDENKIYSKQEIADLIKTKNAVVVNRDHGHIIYSKDDDEINKDENTEIQQLHNKNQTIEIDLPSELFFSDSSCLLSKPAESLLKDLLKEGNSKIIKILRESLTEEQVKQDYLDFLKLSELTKTKCKLIWCEYKNKPKAEYEMTDKSWVESYNKLDNVKII